MDIFVVRYVGIAMKDEGKFGRKQRINTIPGKIFPSFR